MGLTVLHPAGELGTRKDLRVDIVAVHGLNGHPTETWTHQTTNACWLKDFLPSDIDGARIMTFGYNAGAAFGNTTADVNDHAKDLLSSLIDKREEDEEASRPLIFIAHSLGGIIVKKALFGARLEAQYHALFKSTLGIVFLGTPHRGIGKATYGHILANVATAVMHKPSSRLTGALKTNSPELLQLTSQFRHQLPNYQVVSFYETRPTKPFSSLIVGKHSALLEVDGEDQIPVNADHRDMCKFAGRDDEAYEKLFKRVRRMVKRNGVEADSGLRMTKSRNKHYVLPRHVSAKFTGRKEISQKLKHACLSKMDQKIQRRVVLYGMGGSGKTQICLKFAQDHRDNFWGIFWIDASNSETAERGFLEIAQICGLEPEFIAVKRSLTNLEDPWLLIIDNADDPQMDVSRYFPPGDRGTILLTTRNPDCTFHATCGSIEIREMELDDAITLLLTTSEAEDVLDAKPVVETLGCLALAIVQAGAVIRRKICKMEEYCGVYCRRRKELLNDLPSDDYRYTVYTTFEVSFRMIENLSDDISRNAIELLQFFCFLHYDGIPADILEQAWKNMREGETSDWEWSVQLGVLRQDTSQEWDSYSTRKAISLLSSFSLITVSRTGDRISMHPLVHSWVSDKMSEDERKRCWIKAASTLAMSIRWEYHSVNYRYRRFLFPHVQTCLSLRMDELFVEGGGRAERLGMASTFALVYEEAGRWNTVVVVRERVVEGFGTVLGEENALTLRRKSQLGDSYLEAGEVPKALEILEQVLKAQRGIHSTEHKDVCFTISSLASCHSALGQHHESKNLNEATLKIETEIYGEEDLDTLNSMSNLAIDYHQLGQTQMARELEEKVFENSKRALGEEHPNTLNSMCSLAISYSKLGQWQKAAELEERALELRTRVLGVEHSDTLNSMYNLAISYSDLGQWQKAAELEERMLELRTRVQGVKHPDTLRTMNNLAVSYNELGRVEEAIQLCNKGLGISMRTLGEQDPQTVRFQEELARSYWELGRVEEATRLCKKGLEISMRTLGEHHHLTADFQKRLTEIRQDSTQSLEVSAPDSISHNATDLQLAARARRRWHPRSLLTKLRPSTGPN